MRAGGRGRPELSRTDLEPWEQMAYARAQKKKRRASRVKRVTHDLEEMRRVCADHGIELRHNSEQHWSFHLESGRMADWWPSSGKVVFDKNFKRPRKATSTTGLWNLLRGRWL